VLAHALFARKSEFGRRDRAGLSASIAAEGWRTLAFDFRGHGESELPKGAPPWGYDDLVRRDLPAVVACARMRGEGRPVVLVGHSLGGHVGLAAQGTGRLAADGIVAIASGLWLRELEPSALRWVAKRALGRTMREGIARLGRLPRRLRLGSDDATVRFIGDLVRFMDGGGWRSEDGEDDYLASLAQVNVPVCAVVSDGDRVCRPRLAEAFVQGCAGPLRVLRVARSDDGARPPGHMALVTSGRARLQLLDALAWVGSRADVARHDRP
jgi:predicted alpha/beta hydrolase